MPSESSPPRRAARGTPARPSVELVLPSWWGEVEGTFGTVLGAPASDAIEMFAALDPEEREAYKALLAYHQLRALAHVEARIVNLDVRLGRAVGLMKEGFTRMIDALAPIEEEEEPEEEEPEEEEEEEEEAPPPPPVKKPRAPRKKKEPAPAPAPAPSGDQ